jgi:hypothetical protein
MPEQEAKRAIGMLVIERPDVMADEANPFHPEKLRASFKALPTKLPGIPEKGGPDGGLPDVRCRIDLPTAATPLTGAPCCPF